MSLNQIIENKQRDIIEEKIVTNIITKGVSRNNYLSNEPQSTQEQSYEGFKKIEETNYSGGTSIKYWM